MDEPQVPVPPVVLKTTKSVVSAVTTLAGVLSLFATQIADGNFTWTEGGALIAAVAAAGATIYAVWRVPNEPK
jgi:hypothetical protein